MGQCASVTEQETAGDSGSLQVLLQKYGEILYEARPTPAVREIILYCELFRIQSHFRIVVEVPVVQPSSELSPDVSKIYEQIVQQRQSPKKRKMEERADILSAASRDLQRGQQLALNSYGYYVRPEGTARNKYRLCRRLHVELWGISALSHTGWAAEQSRRVLKHLLPFGMGIQLWIKDYKADGSVVADILRLEDRLHVNRTLLVTGWGILHPNAQSEHALLELERFARRYRVGIWAYRQQRKLW
jgi:endonuclease YncB( thermonuclease family)